MAPPAQEERFREWHGFSVSMQQSDFGIVSDIMSDECLLRSHSVVLQITYYSGSLEFKRRLQATVQASSVLTLLVLKAPKLVPLIAVRSYNDTANKADICGYLITV